MREIVSTGCPNHESYCTGKPGNSCGDEGKQTTLVEGKEQSLSVEVPANPKLKSSYTAGELDCSMGTVAYALNGVGFYSGAVAFVSGGPCPQLDVADATAEWISFDCCSGHSTGSGGYPCGNQPVRRWRKSGHWPRTYREAILCPANLRRMPIRYCCAHRRIRVRLRQ